VSARILELSAVSKDYRGLRPLRIEQLSVDEDERVAVVGTDQAAAEVFINLMTGASLPERGEIRAFGRRTADIADSDEWLSLVDRFGIVSERAVLLDSLAVVQNLAMPFTLDIEPLGDEVRARALALAREVGLKESSVDRAVGELEPTDRVRVRVGRAIALDPALLVFEHPTAGMPRADIGPFAAEMAALARRRRAAILALTADREFADAVADRVLTLDPATGRLSEARGWLSRLWRA